MTRVWNWGRIGWVWGSSYLSHCWRLKRQVKRRNYSILEGTEDAYSWRRSWATGKRCGVGTVDLNGVCALDGGWYSWRVAWRSCSRIDVVWETHTAMFRDDGILCLHRALQRFRERIIKRDSACPNGDKMLTIWESGWGVYESSLYCSGEFFISLKFQSIFFKC